MKPLSPLPEVSVRIADHEIRLQARCAGILHLVAVHQAAINSAASQKVIFDCSPGDVTISVQPKLGRVKVKR